MVSFGAGCYSDLTVVLKTIRISHSLRTCFMCSRLGSADPSLRRIPQILMNHQYFFLVGYFIMYEFCGYPLLCFCIQLVSGMLQCYKKCQVMIHLQTCISPLLSRPAERCDCHESSPRGQFRVVHSCIGRPPPFHFGPPWRGSLSGGRS